MLDGENPALPSNLSLVDPEKPSNTSRCIDVYHLDWRLIDQEILATLENPVETSVVDVGQTSFRAAAVPLFAAAGSHAEPQP